MAIRPFTRSFTQQEPIPEDAIAAAVEVMQTGRLHRYNTAPGEESQAAALEREVAAWQGSRFALACASGGAALRIALRAAGIGLGDTVLTNGFTLAPVPGPSSPSARVRCWSRSTRTCASIWMISKPGSRGTGRRR